MFTRPAQAVLGHALQHTLLMMQFLMTRPQSMQRGRYVVARARRMKMSLAAFKEHSKESGVRPADAPRTLPLPPPLARQPGLGRQRRGGSRSRGNEAAVGAG